MFCHLFSILRLGGGSTGTTALGLHMSKSGPVMKCQQGKLSTIQGVIFYISQKIFTVTDLIKPQ